MELLDAAIAADEALDVTALAATPDSSAYRGTTRLVDLDLAAANYNVVSASKPVIAVLKARAYGAGMNAIAARLFTQGCKAFAVATLGEALHLRSLLSDSDVRVIVLGFTPVDGLHQAARHDVSLTITDDEIWDDYVRALEAIPTQPIAFHINADTGMTRVGIPATGSPERAVRLARAIRDSSVGYVEGLYTHFPMSDATRRPGSKEEEFTLSQVARLKTVRDAMVEADVDLPMVHLANSPAVEQYPEAWDRPWVSHVRPGSLIHGMSIGRGEYRRISRWLTELVRVEQLAEDTGVGYGHQYRGRKGQWIGTLPVGYADGFLRPIDASEPNRVRIDGVELDVIGLVAMDMCMVDLDPLVRAKGVPDVGVSNAVELMSDDPDGLLSAESVAGRWGMAWPLLYTGMSTRVERTYAR